VTHTTMRSHVRFPGDLGLRSVFGYLSRAYAAEPQPVSRINEGLTFLGELGFEFVWTGENWGLQCRLCGKVYMGSGRAKSHKCPSDLVDAASSERAKRTLGGPGAPPGAEWMRGDQAGAERPFQAPLDAERSMPLVDLAQGGLQPERPRPLTRRDDEEKAD
jgi:hypothetical protein